jgi:NAD(P)-dependent dehydrogenase (short-subunit alcohol dehydrogenase family)
MTGGTSGFGVVAARKLIRNPSTRVFLGVRKSPGPDGATALPLDLACLDSVRVFASEVSDRIGASGIAALILNAGGGFPATRTVDGFETNFAVNHLAHYLLLRLLLPKLADGATVVLTTSGAHDPAKKTVIPPPKHADAIRLANPERDPDADASPRAAAGRAYSASKLCNLLTAQALAAHPEARVRNLSVIAYSPGPTPGTGLVRDRGAMLDFVWRRLGPALRFFMPRLNSPDVAGEALAELVLGAVRPPEGRVYALLERGRLCFPDPSELARRDDVMKTLWRDSAILVGLAEQNRRPIS